MTTTSTTANAACHFHRPFHREHNYTYRCNQHQHRNFNR